jgi:toxin ParE1/3/4
MSYSVVFTPEAEEQLVELYRYIANDASPAVAEQFTSAIVEFCVRLVNFPHRSARRDDIRPGLFVTQYRSRVVIAYSVDNNEIVVIGVFYGVETSNHSWAASMTNHSLALGADLRDVVMGPRRFAGGDADGCEVCSAGAYGGGIWSGSLWR